MRYGWLGKDTMHDEIEFWLNAVRLWRATVSDDITFADILNTNTTELIVEMLHLKGETTIDLSAMQIVSTLIFVARVMVEDESAEIKNPLCQVAKDYLAKRDVERVAFDIILMFIEHLARPDDDDDDPASKAHFN